MNKLAFLEGYISKSAEEECLLGEPGVGQAANKEAGLPGRGLGRATGSGRHRELLKILKKFKEKKKEMNKLAFLEGYMSKASEVKLDIDIGDILLGGRFKNQREIVRKIGIDELGQPTINGKKLLSFRIEKKLPVSKQSKKTQESKSD